MQLEVGMELETYALHLMGGGPHPSCKYCYKGGYCIPLLGNRTKHCQSLGARDPPR